MKLFEAITIRNRARAAARALKELLADKTLPATLRRQVETLHASLGKTWSDLAADAQIDPEPKQESAAPLQESANVGAWLESRIHTIFTELTDDLYGNGYLTRDERITLSGAIGDALGAFVATVETDAAQLYQRARWEYPPEEQAMMMSGEASRKLSEPAKLDSCVRQVMGKGHTKDSAYAICQAAMQEDAKPSKGVTLEVFEMARAIMTGKKPAKESAEQYSAPDSDLDGDFIPLIERAVRNDGTIPIKLIQPGWGTSGFYSPELLERYGPQVFKTGTQMYWDHQTRTEEAERPEGSLRNLAAELVSDARWVPEHNAGPGLYADAKVFEGYRAAVNELAPHIGVSIRALGKAEHGQAEGKAGPIIKAIAAAKSVDFVTSPGAGGQILQLFEARRGAVQGGTIVPQITVQEGENLMDEKELKALQEANAQLSKTVTEQASALARLQEMSLLREAGEFVALELHAHPDLPAITASRLLRDLAKNPPVKEGKLDGAAYKTQIAEAVKGELAYLASVTGAGQVRGMGSTTAAEPKPEEAEKALAEAFGAIGLSESTAKLAAKGRG